MFDDVEHLTRDLGNFAPTVERLRVSVCRNTSAHADALAVRGAFEGCELRVVNLERDIRAARNESSSSQGKDRHRGLLLLVRDEPHPLGPPSGVRGWCAVFGPRPSRAS